MVEDIPIPGQLAVFDNCDKWFMTTCVSGSLLSNIVICLVIPIWNRQ